MSTSGSRTRSGAPAIIGVSNTPGAMVHTLVDDVDDIGPSGPAEFLCGLLTEFFIQIENRNAASLLNDHLRGRPPEAGSSASDDGYLSSRFT